MKKQNLMLVCACMLLLFGHAVTMAHIVDAAGDESPILRNPVDLAISPDGRWAVVVCHNNSVAVIDLNSDERTFRNINPHNWPGVHPLRALFIGTRCFVINEYSNFITEFDPESLEIIANHPVPLYCQDMIYDQADEIIYISNRWLDEVLIFDRNFNSLGGGIKVGRNPKSLTFGANNLLYVGNAGSWNISVIDRGSMQVVATHYLGSAPTGLAEIGGEIAATNHGGRGLEKVNGAPLIRNDQQDIINVVTFIDPQSGSLRELYRDAGGDYMDLAAGSGLLAFVSGATGTVHIARQTDLENSLQTIDLLAEEWQLPGGFAASGLRIYSHTTAVAIKDQRTVYCANYFRDSVVELKFIAEENRFVVRREIPLNNAGVPITAFQGGKPGFVVMNPRQNGERYFKTIAGWARGQRDMTCATCHPDGHSDFRFIVDERPDPYNPGQIQGPEKHISVIGSNLTAPFAWEGTAQSLRDFNEAALDRHDVQNGSNAIHNDVVGFMAIFEDLLRPEPNPFPKPNGDLNSPNAPERGKKVFVDAGCLGCHNGASFTDRLRYDVGTGRELDTPSLLQLWDKAPYLHDGRAKSLADVLDPANYAHADAHGTMSKLDENAKNDLVAYLNAITSDDAPTAIDEQNDVAPADFSLAQNYPNPFNPSTSIEYRASRPAQVEIAIYNVLGQRIRLLVSAKQQPGRYAVRWDGADDTGRQVAAGVYVYQMKAGTYITSRKMLVLE